MGAYHPLYAIPDNRRAIILTKIVKIRDFRRNFGNIAIGIGVFYVAAARVYDSANVRISSLIPDPTTPTLRARCIEQRDIAPPHPRLEIWATSTHFTETPKPVRANLRRNCQNLRFPGKSGPYTSGYWGVRSRPRPRLRLPAPHQSAITLSEI